ncbi:MAG: tetratricopeptide repeat protein [Desulfarculaceae bacterium]|nr:tetratricopeptide repeat protein [Desulfarculaceae bacterium]MCF8047067.1 tetratricopeptide repeat protein [Desulfarculaceae bacterium]MCF8065235.1 tetratricopeptide repeat protein [Desulfarculaceae bacterium]MCF8098709.1 tetratricopeptide repeat protein [Desulfarculaceae bacterium]MCF8123939.1 tetratricopeptide repeat protein [Desulfarculaceae bacterium]
MKLRFATILGLIVLLLAFTLPAMAQSDEKVDLGIITVKQKDLANQLAAQLAKGASFETLAKRNSVGPASFRGGRLGKVPYARLRSEYRTAIEGLAPGKPSKVIPTEEGYTILMRFDKPGESTAPATPAFKAGNFNNNLESSTRFSSAAPPMDTSPGVPEVAASAPQQKSDPEAPYLTARRKVLAGVEALIGGKLKQAESNFSQALGDNPREDSAVFLLEMTRQGIEGKVKPQAIKLFAEGFLAITENDGTVALEKFLACKKADPGFWQGELFAANMLAGQGKRDEARRIIEKEVLTRNPSSSRAYVTLGLMAADDNKPNQARKYLERAVQLNPDFAQAHYQLGMMSLYGRDFKTAERQFKQTIVLDPFNDQACNNLGLVYLYTNRPQEAEKMYKKALSLNPTYPDAHVNLGNLYVAQKKLNQAIDEYVKALAIDPKFGAAYSNMAGAYALKGDWIEAALAADRALELGYRVPQGLLNAIAPHRAKETKSPG